MKKLIRSMAVIMVLTLSITAVGVMPGNAPKVSAAKTTANEVKTKKKIKLSKKKATMRVNQTLKLKLKNAKAKKVKWSSSKKKIATVSKNGKVRARKTGKTTITATYKGKKYKCKITIKKAKKSEKVINLESMPKIINNIDGITLHQAEYLADSLYESKNILVSPVSLNMALGMAANAATPDALKDLEGYLGKPLAQYNQHSLNQMNRAEKDEMLTLANGVWYKDICTINPVFSDSIAKYFKGEIKAAPFNQTTAGEINQWASDKTEGMIPKIIEEIPKEAVSIFANALLFKGKWTSPFKKTSDIINDKFTMYSGSQKTVKMMCGTVGTYFENDNAVGFEKTYGEEEEYSFIGILPKKKGEFKLSDLNVEELLATETYGYDVNIQIPKFTYSWDGSLKNVLSKTSIKSIFNNTKNPMGNLLQNWPENVWVDDINQSCKIVMDENGTKAAAVTSVVADTTCAISVPREIKTVKLNRPFAYIIRDNTTKEVMFMGKVIDITQK